ncbi:MAG: hypothetical protein M1833_006567 [Piccolia ochrophora]|nr:MAG: hypothetical protein M1833_006567 [Piccolia ochrophora]
MPDDGQTHHHDDDHPSQDDASELPNVPAEPRSPPPRRPLRDLFTIPAPLKQLFDRFPLLTYAPNPLPLRSPAASDLPTLYIFTTPSDAERGLPSFNPSCLKWQTYLKLCNLPFRTQPSTNHASPTGALPFLLPSRSLSSPSAAAPPIPSTAFETHIQHLHTTPSPTNPTTTTITPPPPPPPHSIPLHLPLLTTLIRPAYLHALYLAPTSLPHLRTLYIDPSTASAPARRILTSQLRLAAAAELAKPASVAPHASAALLLGAPPVVDVARLYADADRAFEALDGLLGAEHEWFFGKDRPGLFDAEVFAYTGVVGDEERFRGGGEGEEEGMARLRRGFAKCDALVRHRRRVWERCYAGEQ